MFKSNDWKSPAGWPWGGAVARVRPPMKKELKPSIRILTDNWLDPIDLAGRFPKVQPLEIDLGCGKGRFLLARAKNHPEVNFLGIDRMLKRIRKIDNRVRRRGDENIRLLRMEGYYATTYLVPTGAVRTYYIFHPDPWPKKRHAENRLFSPRFLDALHRTLEPGGCVHAATDHLPYYDDICSILRADARFEEIPAFVPIEEERTDFELWYLDKGPIGRISIRKKSS